MSNIFLGVDPGASGGLAAVWENGLVISQVPMPDTEEQLYLWFSCYAKPPYSQHCVGAAVERVTGYVGDGGNPGSRMFTFGQNYGACRMAMVAVGIPFQTVIPSAWQKEVSVRPRGKSETKTVWKNRLKARAEKAFPGVKVTLATADALLIAEALRRREVWG